MEATLKKDYLLIVLYLMTYLANKRQGVIGDIKLPAVNHPDTLNNVLTDIKEKYNIDVYKVSSTEDIMRAESILGQYLSSLSMSKDSSSSFDEMLLLRDSIDITKEQLSDVEYDIEEGVVHLFKDMNIPNIDLVKSWFSTPDFARYFKIEDSENIIATKVVVVNGIKKILFSHMLVNRNRGIVIGYNVVNALIVSYYKFSDMFSSPIRLYLYLLDEYGIDITIGDETKKLFYKKELKQDDTIKLEHSSKNFYYGLQRYQSSDGSYYYTFVQAFDYSLFLKDYLNKNI